MTAEAQLIEELEEARAEAQGLRFAVRALAAAAGDLVDALPACDVCGAPATRAFVRGSHRWCDVHGRAEETAKWVSAPGPAPEYPRAKPLRLLMAILRTLA